MGGDATHTHHTSHKTAHPQAQPRFHLFSSCLACILSGQNVQSIILQRNWTVMHFIGTTHDTPLVFFQCPLKKPQNVSKCARKTGAKMPKPFWQSSDRAKKKSQNLGREITSRKIVSSQKSCDFFWFWTTMPRQWFGKWSLEKPEKGLKNAWKCLRDWGKFLPEKAIPDAPRRNYAVMWFVGLQPPRGWLIDWLDDWINSLELNSHEKKWHSTSIGGLSQSAPDRCIQGQCVLKCFEIFGLAEFSPTEQQWLLRHTLHLTGVVDFRNRDFP